jgi:hypothetical protein
MSFKFRIVFIAMMTVCGLAGTAAATPPELKVPRVTRAPQLEDFLAGTPREVEFTLTDFRQREPGDSTPVSQKTVAHLSYDDKNFYVVFVCQDEPGQVRAHMAKREDIASDDQVSIFLDTFHDRQRAYMFATNPLGVQLDGIATEGQTTDLSFDAVWHSEGKLTEDGYITLIAIPFKSLRFSSEDVQTWGIALGRTIARKNENAFWPTITRRVEGFVQQMAMMNGMVDISPGRNIQLTPYGIVSTGRFLETTPGKPAAFRTEHEGRFGLDTKVILRDSFALDITVNPDFSQVESDEPQVTVNQRFEVFFPEKRPFFLENAGFFRTPVNLFFTRRVADPEFGVRLSGKLGSWAIGGLAIDDRAPGRRVAEDSPVFGEKAKIAVARVQREFAGQSSVGVLATTQDFGTSSNRVVGVDTRLRLNPNWLFYGQAIATDTRRLDRTHLSGQGYLAQISHSGRHFRYLSRYQDFNPEFVSSLGFIQRVNIRRFDSSFNYQWRPKGRKVLSYGPQSLAFVQYDHKGKLQDWFANAGFAVELPRHTTISSTRFEALEVFRGIEFRKNGYNIVFNTEWLRWLAVSAFWADRTAANFFPPAGISPFLANAQDASFDLTVRPSPRFRFSQTYIYTRLGTREGTTPVGLPQSAAIFTNHIFRSKANYQFTREFSIRAILDYDGVLSNPGLVNLERSKRITADVLGTYLISPGTALYVGYTDNYENFRLDPLDPSGITRTGSPTTAVGRQFFVKLSYQFRL